MNEEYYFDYLDFFLHNCTNEEYDNISDYDRIGFELYFLTHKKPNVIYHFCFE